MKWMIYGATGYTGQLVIEEALKRGHQPLLAGRNPDKLEVLAEQYDLDYAAFHLDDETTIADAIAAMDVVYHAAGPFIHTSEPMIRACLATHTHYVDITGEIDVFEQTYRYDDAARKVGIALVSGAGFDVIPSDALAAYVAGQVMAPTHLQTGIFGFSGFSTGTTKTAIESAAMAAGKRQDGELVPASFAADRLTVTLPNGKTRHAVSFPWGDIAVAYRTTGIPNITSYLAIPPTMATIGRIAYPLTKEIMKIGIVRQIASQWIDRLMTDPDEATRLSGEAYIYARARNDAGSSAAAWMTTSEPYTYTAQVAPFVVEHIMTYQPVGALTPTQALGMDFALGVEGTSRQDA